MPIKKLKKVKRNSGCKNNNSQPATVSNPVKEEKPVVSTEAEQLAELKRVFKDRVDAMNSVRSKEYVGNVEYALQHPGCLPLPCLKLFKIDLDSHRNVNFILTHLDQYKSLSQLVEEMICETSRSASDELSARKKLRQDPDAQRALLIAPEKLALILDEVSDIDSITEVIRIVGIKFCKDASSWIDALRNKPVPSAYDLARSQAFVELLENHVNAHRSRLAQQRTSDVAGTLFAGANSQPNWRDAINAAATESCESSPSCQPRW